MSSLRLALKKSLEENPSVASSNLKNSSFDFVDYEEITRVVGKSKRKRASSLDPTDGDSNTKKKDRAALSDDFASNIAVSTANASNEDSSVDVVATVPAVLSDEIKDDHGTANMEDQSKEEIIEDIQDENMETTAEVVEEATVAQKETTNAFNEPIDNKEEVVTEMVEDPLVTEKATSLEQDNIEAKLEKSIHDGEIDASSGDLPMDLEAAIDSSSFYLSKSLQFAPPQQESSNHPDFQQHDLSTNHAVENPDDLTLLTAEVQIEETSVDKMDNDELPIESVDEQSLLDSQSAIDETSALRKDEEEDESTEETTKKSKKSTGKRRSGLLRSLGIMEQSSTDNLEDINVALLDEPGPRLSSRAAAAVAKNRIASKATIIITSSTPREEENAINTATPKPKKSSKSKSSQSQPASTTVSATAAAVSANGDPLVAVAEEVDAPWACCDRCSKWRKLPLTVDSSTLPEQWFCEMNIWDPEHNTCEAEEEVEDTKVAAAVEEPIVFEDSMNPVKQSASSESTNDSEPKSLRSATKSKKVTSSSITHSASKTGLDSTDVYASSRLAQKRKSTSATVGKERSASITVEEKINWIECSRCRKWRKAPPSVDVDSLPDTWVCEQNTWNPSYARCSAKQEPENETMPIVGLTRSSSQTSVGSSNRGTPALQSASTTTCTNNPTATAASSTVPKKILMQWVQCERCEKWRKIPPTAGINHKDLPEKWYCEYNNWDPERAACEVPEESDNENDAVDAAVVAARSQLILANSKGPGALSYRRIIYGTDGRIRPIYSDKSKTGHGLFSFTERMVAVNRPSHADVDAYEEPLKRVSYWASSLYDEAGINYTSSSKAKPPSKDGNAGAVLVSAIKGNPLSKTQLRLEELSRHFYDPYPVDSVLLHFHPPAKAAMSAQWQTSLRHTWPKKLLKSCEAVDNASLLEQRTLFMSIIRSCFASDETMSLSLVDLFDLIHSAHFHSEAANYYRQRVSVDSLKMILKQMEDLGEIYVTTDSSGMCIIHYSKFDYAATTANNGASVVGDGGSSRSAGPLLPPKLRVKQMKAGVDVINQ